MADDPNVAPLPGIAALPPSTARQIGSGQVLVDPSSVVKELIDNALDARAKSIFVDISANSIDSIQVKDDGHGIPAEDRALVCRRYCTSKIRDFHDLRNVGGKWLGFRGEALSSMAEMSGTLFITTRVEGEPVSTKLKYGRNGELFSTERESHPVGTTVKVNNFLEHIPVRKQTALKSSSKWLAKIRRLTQAYALARPSVRFRLHILKAKNTKGDFVYAPKADFNVEDAVLKVIGKDCALQCDWTVLEKDDFEVHAFLPKPTATGAKIANQGAFISVDSRPVSNSRGTMKQVVTAFKSRLCRSNISLGSVRDPFFCMNIICPPDSYDPNIEPAKDDVLFENETLVVSIVDELLKSFYPEADPGEPAFEPPVSAQLDQEPQPETTRDQTPSSIYEDAEESQPKDIPAKSPQEQPRWRSSMYGIDEDDLEFLQENQPPVVEEEEGLRDVAISNPWTIARMNAAIKPKKLTNNGQLLSPAKSHANSLLGSSSPLPVRTLPVLLSSDSLTPEIISRNIIPRSSLDRELEQSIQRLGTGPSSRRVTLGAREQTAAFNEQSSLPSSEPRMGRAVQSRQQQRKKPTYTNKPFSPPAQGPSATWFGQPMPGSQPMTPPRRQKRSRNQDLSLFPKDVSSNFRDSDPSTAEDVVQGRLHSKNNTDIRSFFGGTGKLQNSYGLGMTSSFTPINGRLQRTDFSERPIHRNPRQEGCFEVESRATSAEPYTRSTHARGRIIESSNLDQDSESLDMAAQFRAYVAREGPPRSMEITTPTHITSSSEGIDNPIHAHEVNGTGLNPCNTPHYSNASQNAIPQLSSSPPSPKQHVGPSSTQSHNPIHQNTPHSPPPFYQPTQSRSSRPRTTSGPHRTKSSLLPLERVPHAFRIQNTVLCISISMQSIRNSARTLDMRGNSLEWGYPADGDDVYDGVSGRVGEKRVGEWAGRLDGVCRERWGGVHGVDVRSALYEGVKRGVSRMQGEGESEDREEGSGEVITISDDDESGEDTGEHCDDGAAQHMQEEEVEISGGDASKGSHKDTETGGDEMQEGDLYDGDVDDEMLMGL